MTDIKCAEQPLAVQNPAPQLSPQLRQLLTVPSCVLQPCAGVPQFFQPELQVGVHEPFVHEVAEALALPQTTPQPPQFVLSLPTGSSQPLAGMPSQSAYSPAQAGLHALLLQVFADTCAAAAVLHTLLHAPQLAGSLAVLMAQPFCGLPQARNFPVQIGTQVPPLQEVLGRSCSRKKSRMRRSGWCRS